MEEENKTANSEKTEYEVGYAKPPIKGRFQPGQSGNPSGRPKNTMKDYMRRMFMEMSDADKKAFLKKVPAVDQIKLAEGNPHNTQDFTSGDESLSSILVKFINGKDDRDTE